MHELLTCTAQTLLIKTPDKFSTQVTPGEMSMAVGLEVMTQDRFYCVTSGCFDADAVSNQTNNMEGAGLTWVYRRRGCAGCRGSQLNRIVYTEVLQLNQFTFRHRVLDRSGCLLSIK